MSIAFEIPLSPPDFLSTESTLSLEELTQHSQAFATSIASVAQRSHCTLTNSGSAALQLALTVLGIQSGDEVLCQSLTFVASANGIVHRGATPIFIDSEPDTWNMCPDTLETALQKRTQRNKRPKAVIAVDVYGMPAQWSHLQAICDRYDIPLIEDAAEAVGSYFQNQACGSFGRLSVLSFNTNKIITTLGGGALLANEQKLVNQARTLGSQAKTLAPHYEHEQAGYNFAFHPMAASLGLTQVGKLPQLVNQRRAHFDAYRKALGQLPGICFQPEPENCLSNRWLTAFTIDPRESGVSRTDIMNTLAANQIESRPVFKPMHCQPVYKKSPFVGTGLSEIIFEQGLCLPSGSSLTDIKRQQIIEIILAMFR